MRPNSLGIRPQQKSFKMKCPAKIYASVNRDEDCFVVHQLDTEHNHQILREIFNKYPEQRKLGGEEKELVKTMLDMKVKVKLLQDHIQTQGNTFITVKDLHNIRQKMRLCQYGDKTEEEILINELEKIGEDDPDSELSLQINEQGVIEFLLIVTGEMKQTFINYPEVLMVDGTYRVNKLKMPLYNFLVEDGHGIGRSIALGIVANEKKETIQNLMKELKKIHDLEKVNTIIVDNDMNEISALKQVAPNCSIQICKFHVIQAINREIRKLSVDQGAKNKLGYIVKSIVYAKSLQSFENHLEGLSSVAPLTFMNYLKKNWLEDRHMWAAYLTNQHVNLGNSTNNRVESFNQKVKDILHHNMSIPEAVQSLLLLLRTVSYKVSNRQFDESMKVPYSHENDEGIDSVVKCLTPYASNIVINELKAARSNTARYCKEKCKCTLKHTMGLPCKHTFSLRLKDGQKKYSFLLTQIKDGILGTSMSKLLKNVQMLV